MNSIKQEQAAQAFAERWAGKGYEKGESQIFWTELLTEVLGVERPSEWISFEEQVKLDHTSFIDGHITKTHVLIEQKSLGRDLRAPIKQSDGSMLSPFQQAKRYAAELPYSQRPRWIVTCNFSDFLIYDMEKPNSEPEHLELKDLGQEYYRLQFLVNTGDAHIQREMEISLKAGRLVGMLYDKLLEQYHDKTSAESLRSLNILCVRLVFCLYAEDAGVFPGHDLFHDYLASFHPQNVRIALRDLFRVLNTKQEDRDPYMEDNLRTFPYVNGGLFAEDDVEIPRFTEEIVTMLLNNASLGFDWSGISPTIFGAVFESTLNPETRRSGGMHYTSIENIHKVIDPLFLNELRAELESAQNDRQLKALQAKLATLTFLDPACGSGNFLTETYISLRRIENEIILRLSRGQSVLGFNNELSPVEVSISQFYGIEINDFAVTVARTALWIAEHQMLKETQKIVAHDLDFLPLKSYNNIREGDALELDWCEIEDQPNDIVDVYADRTNLVPRPRTYESDTVSEPVMTFGNINLHTNEIVIDNPVLPKRRTIHYNYIMGNPPFVGARMMEQGGKQKRDVQRLFGNIKDVQDLDYVTCWYKRAARVMCHDPQTEACFVSTNSICQGAQVPILWGELLQLGVKINFAYPTFSWKSEADEQAAVHCVIIGFAMHNRKLKKLFPNGSTPVTVSNISPYLVEGSDTVVVARREPICDVPPMNFGNQPRDGGHFILTDDQRTELLNREPGLERWIRQYMGADEFIKGKRRWCLWLRGASPMDIKQSKTLYEIVNAVRDFRLASSAKTTQGYAKVPHLFAQMTQPEYTDFLIIPRVSSERRRYAPIGFANSSIITSDAVQIVPNATLYHFGILTSNVHMAWMRVVCGRLKSDYRYSKEIVYNTFPWPTPTEAGRTKIEQTAQAILDARALYPTSTLAALYDEALMPIELRRAHQANDRAVMAAYGFPVRNFTEQDCVARLMELYQALTT